VRCRATVRKRADNQDPQFETYREFQCLRRIPGTSRFASARRYSVYFETTAGESIAAHCTALPSDPDKPVELALYPESDRSRWPDMPRRFKSGLRRATWNCSTSTPIRPPAIKPRSSACPCRLCPCFWKATPGTSCLEEFLAASDDRSLGISLLTDAPEGARYTLSAENDCYLLKLRETGKLIQGAKGYTQAAADYMFAILKRVAAWERAVQLQNHSTKMNPDDVQFKFCELLGDDDQRSMSTHRRDHHRHRQRERRLEGRPRHAEGEQSLAATAAPAAGPLRGRLRHPRCCTTSGRAHRVGFHRHAGRQCDLQSGPGGSEGDQAVHTFKLIVSTEKVDDFLLGQDPLEIGGSSTLAQRGVRRV
jgi:hypothetical protein